MSNPNFQGPPGTNPPMHQLSPRQKRGSSTAWIAGTVVVAVLIVGGLMMFAKNADRMNTASNTPVTEQRAPAPVPAPSTPLTPQSIPAPVPEQR